MRFPTWSQLPKNEKITIGSSLGFLLGAVYYFSFWANGERIIALLKFAGLGTLVLTAGVTIHAAARLIGDRTGNESAYVCLARWVVRHRAAVVVWLLCSLVTIITFPPGNRVLMDEIVVLSTSKAIHEEREPVTPSTIETYNGIHKLTAAYIDKRPYLFATIVALFHDILGYSAANAFYANMVLGVLTLALTGIVGARLGGTGMAGIIAMLALTSIPLFCEHATGGGIDVLNLFSLSLVILIGMLHVEAPSLWSTRALLGAGVLLAYSRYESLLFLAMPAVMIAVVFSHRKRFYLDWPALLLWPAMIPLCGVHYLTFSRSAEWFQLADQGVTEAFSLRYFPENIGHALAFFLNTEHLLTNSVTVFVAGVVAVLLVAVATLGRWRRMKVTGVGAAYWSFALVSFGSFGLLMAYSWGKLDQVVASRLSLPVYLLFVLSIAAVFREIKNQRLCALVLAAVFSVSLYWSCFPLAAKLYGAKLSPGLQIQALMDEFNATQPDRHFAVINAVTNFWLTRDVYSLAPATFKGNPKLLANMLKSAQFRRIYLIQALAKDPNTGQYDVVKKEVLSLPVDAQLITEDFATDETRLRVSLIRESSVEKLESITPKANRPEYAR